MGKEMMNSDFEISLFIIRSDFLHAAKILRHEAESFTFLLNKEECCGLSPLKIHGPARFEQANLGSNGKHANHYTPKVIK
jgi:hypothetical protein